MKLISKKKKEEKLLFKVVVGYLKWSDEEEFVENVSKMKEFLKKFEKGGIDCCTEEIDYIYLLMGMCYQEGKGIKKNIPKSIENYEKSIKKKNGFAMHQLAYLYLHGIGKNKDVKESLNLFKKASKKGISISILHLGEIHLEKENYDKAFQCFNRSSEMDDILSILRLAKLYEFGHLNIKKDYKKSFQFYEKASMLGDSFSFYKMAIFYENSLGKKKKKKKKKNLIYF